LTRAYIAYMYNAGADDQHGVVKIGFSKNPASRFDEMAAMSWIGPKWIEATTKNTAALGSDIERFLHNQLRSHRVHHEWFHVPRDELAAAKQAVWTQFGESFFLLDISDEDWEEKAA
jgi:hypothetical protein